MKLYLYLFLFVSFITNKTNAQLIIATDKNTVNTTESTLVQFQDNDTKGIILPANTTTPINVSNGTFLFDQSENKVKMYENESWVDLSDTGDHSTIVSNNSFDSGEGVIIGADTSIVDGVLVLESTNKALVLPRVNDPVVNVISPYPGMICYDTKSKTIAIFDGKLWNFWK